MKKPFFRLSFFTFDQTKKVKRLSNDRGNIQDEQVEQMEQSSQWVGWVILVPVKLDKVQKCEFVAKLITVKKVAKTNLLKLVSRKCTNNLLTFPFTCV